MSGSGGKRRTRPEKGRVFAPPDRSGRIYVRIAPSLVHLFRFHLEAEDNLGVMTVVDRWAAILMIRFSPHQEREALAFLAGLEEPLGLRSIPVPRSQPTR